ncbi:zeta toxin family protein [Spirosoma sp. SC4-14]|uniref:zeta toxin family protein n=1 Tax=Spirosoma sp. SC4-14 TaxID=3128900 RepID=UPI0030D5C7F7
MLLDLYTEEELFIAKDLILTLNIGAYDQYQSETPRGILLGGQPASGKTALMRNIRQEFNEVKFIVINGDEYRQFHPRAKKISETFGQDAPKYTQAFSNALVEHLKAECLRSRCNFIIEGTMRSFDVIQKTAQQIKQAGFYCEAHVLAIHRNDSWLGIFQRFEGDKQRTGIGRFSPVEVHDEAYRQIPVNLNRAQKEGLFDRIAIYTRLLTDGLTLTVNWLAHYKPEIDFISEFNRLRVPLLHNDFYRQQWLAIKLLAEKRGETNAGYLRLIDEFMALYS